MLLLSPQLKWQNLKDKKRVIPCASLCEGEFGIDGYFIGVPTVIGSNGVEQILEFSLTNEESKQLNNTLNAVKKPYRTNIINHPIISSS